MHRSRACEVLQMEHQLSRLGDVYRYPVTGDSCAFQNLAPDGTDRICRVRDYDRRLGVAPNGDDYHHINNCATGRIEYARANQRTLS